MGARLRGGVLHRLDAPVDREAGHDPAGQARVVVEEADRANPGSRIALGRPGHQHADLAGPVEQRVTVAVGPGRCPARGVVPGRPDAEPDAADDGDRDEELDQPERAREPFCQRPVGESGPRVEDGGGNDRAERDGHHDPDEVGNAGGAPSPAVEAKPDVDDRPNDEEETDDDRERRFHQWCRELVQAKRERQVRRHDDPDEVDREEVAAAQAACEGPVPAVASARLRSARSATNARRGRGDRLLCPASNRRQGPLRPWSNQRGRERRRAGWVVR